MNIPEQIKITRHILKENQSEFGKRFDVSPTAVCLWEKGVREAPYEVINFIVGENAFQFEWEICGECCGKGYISKKKQSQEEV